MDYPELDLDWYGPIYKKEWQDIDNDLLQARGIYFIGRSDEILYIGQTYDQNFLTRLYQHLTSQKSVDVERRACLERTKGLFRGDLYIKVGILRQILSRHRINLIENTLIFFTREDKNQAKCNVALTESTPFERFILTNHGEYYPLDKEYDFRYISLDEDSKPWWWPY